MTVVRPELQFGVADLDDDGLVRGFHEKPRSDSWVNGGFFCFEPGVFDYLGEDSVLEREPLERLAADGQLRAFRHEGFWDCMDTYKDAVLLNDLWESGEPPWQVWAEREGAGHRRAGFAGSCLAKALLDCGADVTSLDRGGDRARAALDLLGIAGAVNDVAGDLRDGDLVRTLLRGRAIDTVFHLAAQAIVGDAQRLPRADLRGQHPGDLGAARGLPRRPVSKRVVVASSDKAYGAHDELPYTEDSALQPIFPYDVSKAATDLIARSYWHTYGLPVAVTRFANLYGGGDRNFSRLMPEAVTAVLDGRRPVIRSDGSPERDFLYVEDAASAYLAIAEALGGGGGGEAFNAGWGRPHPVREVVDLICELGPGEIGRLPRPGTRAARSTASTSTRPRSACSSRR